MVTFLLLRPQRLVYRLLEFVRRLLTWLFSGIRNEPSEPWIPPEENLPEEEFKLITGDEDSILNLIWGILEF